MASRIVLISGPVSAGKTTLVAHLAKRYGVALFKTRDVLLSRAGGVTARRGELQELGERLDKRTKGRWVRDELIKWIKYVPGDSVVVVDAVRIKPQIDAIRKAFGGIVFHIHLSTPPTVLRDRYAKRKKGHPPVEEFKTYAEVLRNKTEAEIEQLAGDADVVVDTARSTYEDVIVRAASHIGLYGRELTRDVDVYVGGQFGSEGKGHIISYLAREYDLLVRVGGPNAGHTVFEEPEPYTYHHLPSGTRSSEARLLLAPGIVLNEDKLLKEIAECQVESDRLFIDPQALVILKKDIKDEKKIKKSIGSTAQGVGYATARKIRDRGLRKVRMAKDIKDLEPFIKPAQEVLDRAFCNRERVLVEGTQGTGLSLHHGYYPYVTSRDASAEGALSEAGIPPGRVRKVVMVVRTYPIRVQSPPKGTSGIMSQPLDWDEVGRRSGLDPDRLREAEKTSTTKRQRRVAEFDWRLLRKTASLNGPTDIALTFADYLSAKNRQARRFEQLTDETIQFIQEVEKVAAARVSLISVDFASRSIIDRRTW